MTRFLFNIATVDILYRDVEIVYQQSGVIVMRARNVFSISWRKVRVLLFVICSGIILPVGCSSPDPESSSTVEQANKELQSRVNRARDYYEYHDYAKVKSILVEALENSSASDRTEAEELLDMALEKIEPAKLVESENQVDSDSETLKAPEVPGDSDEAVTSLLGKADSSPLRLDEFSPNHSIPVPMPVVDPTPTENKPQPVAEERLVSEEFSSLPIVKQPATETRVKALEERAKRAKTGVEANELYTEFTKFFVLKGDEKITFERNHRNWKTKAKAGSVRYGPKWVEPEVAIKAEVKSEAFLKLAIGHVSRGDLINAAKSLNDASEANLNGVRADYILGMFYSMIQFRNHELAFSHFKTAFHRDPGNISLLNNLALSEFKVANNKSKTGKGNHKKAFAHWTLAVNLAPATPELSQNLGRILHDCDQTTGRPFGKYNNYRKLVIGVYKEKYLKLYSKTQLAGAPEYSPERGWLYMPLSTSETEPVAFKEQEYERMFERNRGTGIVIRPEYVVTSRHVIDDAKLGRAHQIQVAVNGKSYLAHLKNTSGDIALLHVSGLPTLPVIVLQTPLKPELTLNVAGFRSRKISHQLDVVPVKMMVGQKVFEGQRQLYFNVPDVNDFIGGIAFGSTGNIVALLTKPAVPLDGGEGVSYAVPTSTIEKNFGPLLTNHSDQALSTTGNVQNSIVVVKAKMRDISYGLSDLAKSNFHGTNNYLEDITCSHCKGVSTVHCPHSSCVNGFFVSNSSNPQKNTTRGTIQNPGKLTQECTLCKTAKKVSCPFCDNGRDKTLSGNRRSSYGSDFER